jgi:hypothetical protein
MGESLPQLENKTVFVAVAHYICPGEEGLLNSSPARFRLEFSEAIFQRPLFNKSSFGILFPSRPQVSRLHQSEAGARKRTKTPTTFLSR